MLRASLDDFALPCRGPSARVSWLQWPVAMAQIGQQSTAKPQGGAGLTDLRSQSGAIPSESLVFCMYIQALVAVWLAIHVDHVSVEFTVLSL